jgi:UDP-glucose 4-epimerase
MSGMKEIKKRILITGASGTIGSRLIDFLLKQDIFYIIATTRSVSNLSNQHNLEYFLINDVNNFDYDKICKNISVIIHLASTNYKISNSEPLSAFNVNCISSGRLYKAAQNQGVSRFIYFSTAHVYGDLKDNISEESCLNCSNPYATSHRSAEDLIKALSKSGDLNTIIIRLSNSFGISKSKNNQDLLINDLSRQAVFEDSLNIKSKLNLTRNFITLTDVCRATLHLINHKIDVNFETYNLGGDKSYTIYDIAVLIKQRADYKFRKNLNILYDSISFNINEKILFDYNIEKLLNTNFELVSNFHHEIDLLLDDYMKNI